MAKAKRVLIEDTPAFKKKLAEQLISTTHFYKSAIPTVAWQKTDGPGKAGRGGIGQGQVDKSTWPTWKTKLAVTMTDLPEDRTLLTDANIYIISKLVSTHQRHERWPADFDAAGDIRKTRTPRGPGVRVKAHGITWIPVYKGYLALVGEPKDGYPAAQWLLPGRHGTASELFIGLVQAPSDDYQKYTPLIRTLARHNTRPTYITGVTVDWMVSESRRGTHDIWLPRYCTDRVTRYNVNRELEVVVLQDIEGFSAPCSTAIDAEYLTRRNTLFPTNTRNRPLAQQVTLPAPNVVIQRPTLPAPNDVNQRSQQGRSGSDVIIISSDDSTVDRFLDSLQVTDPAAAAALLATTQHNTIIQQDNEPRTIVKREAGDASVVNQDATTIPQSNTGETLSGHSFHEPHQRRLEQGRALLTDAVQTTNPLLVGTLLATAQTTTQPTISFSAPATQSNTTYPTTLPPVTDEIAQCAPQQPMTSASNGAVIRPLNATKHEGETVQLTKQDQQDADIDSSSISALSNRSSAEPTEPLYPARDEATRHSARDELVQRLGHCNRTITDPRTLHALQALNVEPRQERADSHEPHSRRQAVGTAEATQNADHQQRLASNGSLYEDSLSGGARRQAIQAARTTQNGNDQQRRAIGGTVAFNNMPPAPRPTNVTTHPPGHTRFNDFMGQLQADFEHRMTVMAADINHQMTRYAREFADFTELMRRRYRDGL